MTQPRIDCRLAHALCREAIWLAGRKPGSKPGKTTLRRVDSARRGDPQPHERPSPPRGFSTLLARAFRRACSRPARLPHFLVQVQFLALVLALPGAARAQAAVTVVIETSAGGIEVALEPARAPRTVANFLRYVDAGMYNGGRFHRAVRMDNQVREDAKIEVIQGGRDPGRAKARPGFAPIPLERTSVTGLRHVDGAISMARGTAADSASSDFFLCIGDQPSLDFGGARAADGQGFAAFGRVVSGMDVVRAIQRGATNEREQLVAPVTIVRVERK
jgi:peptidyl-prolyl cis-trans isomerase A (cyclophilin A)